MFVSNLNARLAQRFLALVLLPRVRREIQEKQKLHFALFMALKKATYKPGAFYKVCVCWGLTCAGMTACAVLRQSVCSLSAWCRQAKGSTHDPAYHHGWSCRYARALPRTSAARCHAHGAGLHPHVYLCVCLCVCVRVCTQGILLPLCSSRTCSLREAVIITSVLKRTSIPVLHSAAALMRMVSVRRLAHSPCCTPRVG